MSKDNKILNDAINWFGDKKQIIVAIEEMAELTQQLSKVLIGHPNANLGKIVEEYTDVLIMLNQLKIIFDIQDKDIEELARIKLNRIKNIIYEQSSAVKAIQEPE